MTKDYYVREDITSDYLSIRSKNILIVCNTLSEVNYFFNKIVKEHLSCELKASKRHIVIDDFDIYIIRAKDQEMYKRGRRFFKIYYGGRQ